MFSSSFQELSEQQKCYLVLLRQFMFPTVLFYHTIHYDRHFNVQTYNKYNLRRIVNRRSTTE